MSIPTEQEIRDTLEKAPDTIRAYVNSATLGDAFEEIRTRHKLHLDEAGKLTDALVATFLEMRPASGFSDLLKESLEQNSGAYAAVLADINEKIFKPFRKSLEEEVTATADTPATPAPAVRPAEAVRPPSVPLLEKKVNERPQTFSVDAFSEDRAEPEPKKAPEYRSGVDPYRESVE